MSSYLYELSKSCSAETESLYRDLTVLNDQKLWFQLTQKLEVLFFDDDFKTEITNKQKQLIFENFVEPIIKSLDDTKVTEFFIYVLSNDTEKSLEEKVKLLNGLKTKLLELDDKKVNQNDGYIKRINSKIIIDCEMIQYKLELNRLNESVDILKDALDTLENPLFENFVSIRAKLAYYKSILKLNKFNKEYNEYYYNSLLFISCYQKLLEDKYFNNALYLKETTLWVNFKPELYYAILLADKIYHFNEILDNQWVNTESFANDSAQSDKLEALLEDVVGKHILEVNSTEYIKSINELLSLTNETAKEQLLKFLIQKKALVNLLGLIFNENASKKSLTFSEISKKIQVEENEIELLLMKAMSLNLLQGKINQVDQLIKITWIQPRVMTGKEIMVLRDNLVQWKDNHLKTTTEKLLA
ncbi:hypothetical protein ACO0OL_002638 [Hanseniaspora opuntiae]|uniref:26S proteasome regulatory subunit RPN9 n=1 Tax=Hanseniaspora opuntiae TaxID=211096 RepID=A0A1E5RC02_9ASCO|nr:26S proteasome regulatory subunit RPN9 [Hanseniaspora opuntiae]